MSNPKDTVTRRRFTVGAAVAATAALIPGSDALAQSQPPKPQNPQPDAMAKLSPEARAEVEGKITELFRKYGNRLTPEQKADIRKVMAETQDGLEKMRKFVLANGDQPATVLQLYGRREQ